MFNFKFVKKNVAVCMALVVASSCLFGFTSNEKKVLIQDGTVTRELVTQETSIESILEAAKIDLGASDGYTVIQDKSVDGVIRVQVIRAMPIKVWKDRETTSYTIGRASVGEALEALNINTDGYRVYPNANARLQPGMTINLISEANKITVTKEDIPYTIEYRKEAKLPVGEKKVIAPGVKGVKETTSRVIRVGKMNVKKVIDTQVIQAPQKEIVAIGTGYRMLPTSRGYVRYKKIVKMEATAYTLACGNGDGVTSIGIVPYEGIIAVDPRVIPYRTRVYVPGYGFAMAGDTGGAIKGNRIDLFMHKRSDAMRWGRRQVNMYILE